MSLQKRIDELTKARADADRNAAYWQGASLGLFVLASTLAVLLCFAMGR